MSASTTALSRPRWRELTAADLACAAGLLAGLVGAYVLSVLTPTLLRHHAVLLEALAGSPVSIVTGGALARVGAASLTFVALAPLCGVVLYDVFVWWSGRRWGNSVAAYVTRGRPRAARAVNRAESLVRRRGFWALAIAYYLPFPNALIYLGCGTSGMPLWLFLLGDVVGTLLWEALLVSLGWAIGHPAVKVINTIDHYHWQITIGLVVATLVVFAILRARRNARPVAG